MIYLHSLTIVDINLANLTDDKIACFGLNIVDLMFISIIKIYFDLIDLIAPRVSALKILIFDTLVLSFIANVLTRIHFMVLP